MLNLVKDEAERIDSRFLEPACGSGNFLVRVLQRKLAAVEAKFGKSDFQKQHYALLALMCTYGIELLEDNIAECRANMLEILAEYLHIGVDDDLYRAAFFVLTQNLVHGDALTMKTSEGHPITFAEWGYLGKGKFQRRDFPARYSYRLIAFSAEGTLFRTSGQARDIHASPHLPLYDNARSGSGRRRNTKGGSMRDILGKAKTVRELLKGVKYSIDYYQREYKWGEKQARELIDDLTGKFLEEYQPNHTRKQVADYPHYFLGAIIISKKDSASYIVDGQQRLTSLSILLILLRNLQRNRPDAVNIDELIVSEKFGQKSFNLDVDERNPCMEALFKAEPFDSADRTESVQNLLARYQDMQEAWPDELRGDALPYFVDWLLENVHLVEITAYSDDDAYTIFETMNDRGLSLAQPTCSKGTCLPISMRINASLLIPAGGIGSRN